LEAVKVVEVAITANARLAVAGEADITLMVGGAVQVTPAGRVVGQTTVTEPVNPPAGVTVIVELALAPVDELNVTGVEVTENVPELVIVKFTAVELLALKLASPL